MKNFIKENGLTTNGKIKNNFVKNLTESQKSELIKLTEFCPENTIIHIRIKLLLVDATEYPKCGVCSKPVRLHNKDLCLLSTCSKECDYIIRVNKTKTNNLKIYGVESTNVLESVKHKIELSILKNHGVKSFTVSNNFKVKSSLTKKIKYGDPTFVNPSKGKETKLLRYGDSNYNNHDKFIDTCIERYGVEHVMQNKTIFEKQQLSGYVSKKYKHLYYRGTYELLFIIEFEKRFDINDLENCFSIKYNYNNKDKIYFPDFLIKSKNTIIEIKSSWTYDNKGNNEELRNINDKKWEAAKSLSNYSFFPLKSKDEIKLFIQLLTHKV